MPGGGERKSVTLIYPYPTARASPLTLILHPNISDEEKLDSVMSPGSSESHRRGTGNINHKFFIGKWQTSRNLFLSEKML